MRESHTRRAPRRLRDNPRLGAWNWARLSAAITNALWLNLSDWLKTTPGV